MKRSRFFTLGCTGAFVVMVALVAIIYFSLRGPYDLARARWSEKGGGDYTLVVMQYCSCSVAGEYLLTVRGGQVTAFAPLSSDEGPYGPTLTVYTKPSDFQHLTVANM